MRWQTEATLAELDQHIAAFDNPAAEFEEDSEEEEECSASDRDSSLCLDNSSRDEEDSSYYQPVSTVTILKLHTWNIEICISECEDNDHDEDSSCLYCPPLLCFHPRQLSPRAGLGWAGGGVQCCDR